MPDAAINRIGLTHKQTMLLIVIGVVLWGIAAVILRTIAPMGALQGWARALTYALVIPGTLPFVLLTRSIVGLRPDQTFGGIAIATATALLIDGIVVAYFPVIYGSSLPLVTDCAAAILWGAGVGLTLAFICNQGSKT